MEKKTTCPKCGQELDTTTALDGLCPKCLMGVGNLETENTVQIGESADRIPDLTLEEMRKSFPSLEIIELLGRGGMGSVYKARQPGLDRLVALKVIHPRIAQNPEFVERFKREAKTLAKLNHPNIVTVHDFGTTGNTCYLIMEYMDGVNLRQAIRQTNLKSNEVLEIVMRICDALQFAHEEGVVHRDIKPGNILLDLKNRVKIADFGLAKLVSGKADAFSLTQAGKVMGIGVFILNVIYFSMISSRGDLGRGILTGLVVTIVVLVVYSIIVARKLGKIPASQQGTPVGTPKASVLTYVLILIGLLLTFLVVKYTYFIVARGGLVISDLPFYLPLISVYILVWTPVFLTCVKKGKKGGKTLPSQDVSGIASCSEVAKSSPSMSQVAIGIVIFVASFLPWGKIPVRMPFIDITGMRLGPNVTLNGWIGAIHVLGMTIPNWIVVVIALATVVITILRRYTKLQVSPIYAFILSLYGTFHCGLVFSVLLTHGRNNDIGIYLSLGSFLVLLAMASFELFRRWSAAIAIVVFAASIIAASVLSHSP